MTEELVFRIAFYCVVAFCALASAGFLYLFFMWQRGRQDLRIVSTEWKGLGGGIGGLRLSTSFSYALLAALFGFLMIFAVVKRIDADRQRDSEIRKYEDAKQAREADLEKARLNATGSGHPAATGKDNTPAAQVPQTPPAK
jgi:hypothetical protein